MATKIHYEFLQKMEDKTHRVPHLLGSITSKSLREQQKQQQVLEYYQLGQESIGEVLEEKTNQQGERVSAVFD